MKAIAILVLCSALPVLASEPFTGTWREDPTKAKRSRKPVEMDLKDGFIDA